MGQCSATKTAKKRIADPIHKNRSSSNMPLEVEYFSFVENHFYGLEYSILLPRKRIHRLRQMNPRSAIPKSLVSVAG